MDAIQPAIIIAVKAKYGLALESGKAHRDAHVPWGWTTPRK